MSLGCQSEKIGLSDRYFRTKEYNEKIDALKAEIAAKDERIKELEAYIADLKRAYLKLHLRTNTANISLTEKKIEAIQSLRRIRNGKA